MKKKIICVFCNKTKDNVQKMVMGKTLDGLVSCICNNCIEICSNALKKNKNNNKKEVESIPNPKEIFNQLCENVIGQEKAKITLSIAAYNHYKRIHFPNQGIEKSNILMIGPSGSGKTYLVETLSKIMKVPYTCIDCTTITSAGYVGNDVEIALTNLLQAADFNVEKAQKGIVFLDEIDKLRKSSDGLVKDVSGESVQQSLLKMLEGSVISTPIGANKRNAQEFVNFDTKNTLFICSGVFENLDKIITKDMNVNNEFFVSNRPNEYENIMNHLKIDHLSKYGIINELLGRLPILVTFNELSEENLIDILTKPKNSILNQFKELFLIKDNVHLSWTEEAVRYMAKKALLNKTQARSLRAIIEEVLFTVMFNLPDFNGQSLEITLDSTNNLTVLNKSDFAKINMVV